MRLSETERAVGILKERRDAIAGRVTNLYFDAHPQLEDAWKEGRQKCTEDTRQHLDHLCEALLLGQPVLFVEYAAWVAGLLEGLRIPGEALVSNLALLRDVVCSQLEDASGKLATQYLEAAIARIESDSCEPPPFIEGTGELDALAREYLAALLRGARQSASKLILDAVERGVAVKDIYLHVFQRTQYEIGRLWQASEINVAKEHYCSAATQLIMSQLYPYIFAGEKHRGVFVGACVAGGLHEIGGRMIADFFEMDGWNSFYLGANTPTDSVIQTVIERQAAVLGISATTTRDVAEVRELIKRVRAESACAGVKILVGGRPFNIAPDLWRTVHADGSAPDAESATALALRLTDQRAGSGVQPER
jgi:MerR family transcriptional regulator, light-induced transcriptional regulator